MSKKSKGTKIFNFIFIIIICVVLYYCFQIYKQNDFNGFIKAEVNSGISKFTKDSKVKYGKNSSFKIESDEYNDAIFYKKIEVEPNMPYKLSCMVKTENVENEDKKSNSGAQISIANTVECSKSIIGTSDWQKLEFIFDSKNRNEIEIGFRLGGNASNCKGTAWFSDFKLEIGKKDNSSNWNIACFIMENVDVNIDNQNIKLSMSKSDINSMKDNMERFKKSANILSGNKMTVDYDIFEIIEPVKTVTYSDEFAYYLSPEDVEELIGEYLKKEEYDYIFVAVRLGDTFENVEIQVNDWIGLRRDGFKWNWLFKYKTSK